MSEKFNFIELTQPEPDQIRVGVIREKSFDSAYFCREPENRVVISFEALDDLIKKMQEIRQETLEKEKADDYYFPQEFCGFFR